MERTKAEIEKENRKYRIAIIAGIVCGIVWSFVVGWFFSNYYLRSPIIFQKMIMERYMKVSPTPKPKARVEKSLIGDVMAKEPMNEALSNEEVVRRSKYGGILFKIWVLESGKGTAESGLHVFCRNQGKSNEFGLIGHCYESFENAVKDATLTLFNLGVEKDLVNALCSYNLGRLKDGSGKVVNYVNCEYYQNYLKI